MTLDRRVAADRTVPERIFVDYTTGADGPSLVVFAGLHGDEHAGAEALERVRIVLEAGAVPIKGRMRGVLGNIAALERGARYVERDLNRGWWDDVIEKLRAQPPEEDSVEDREMRSLLEVVAGLESETCCPVVYLDLHSTSADGLPFSCIPDTISNLKIALTLPIPVILNLEETIDGPLMGYLSDLGYGGVIVEGGRHDDPRTVDVLESSIWILLVAIGCVKAGDVPRFDEYRKRLVDLAEGLPRVLEVKDRHYVRDGDGFRMEPGFTHHTKVQRGQLLANDGRGELRASRSGRILMPLYKPPADIGYFLTADIPAPYVRMLYLLRRLRLDRIVHWLPGTMRDSENRNLIRIETWVPERMVDLVRLLGWRRLYRGTRHSLLRRRRVRRD